MFQIGIDSVEISRIEESLKNERFLKEYFGENEINELEKRKFPTQSIAACFAAKEAFSKAVGTGFGAFSLKEAEVLHNEKGKPYLSLHGKAKELLGDFNTDLSITHTDLVASAAVILYK